MRTVQLELLRPGEILAERERCSIVYLPVGPLEWHGPAMPYGTDALLAQSLARCAAERTGGVVMPTLFIARSASARRRSCATRALKTRSGYMCSAWTCRKTA